MNILIVTHWQNPNFMTAPFVDYQMEAHVRRGHRVRAIVPLAQGKKSRFCKRFGKTAVRKDHNGVEYVFVRYLSLSRMGRKGFNAWSFTETLERHLDEVLEDFQPDVIHAHTVLIDGRMGVWLKKKLGVPLVLTTHGSDIREPLRLGWGSLLKEICDEADAVTACSSVLAKDCQKFNMKGEAVPILLGYAPDIHVPETERIPKRLIQVSSFISSKRIDTTIEAFEILHREDPSYQLVLIGEGELLPKMKALAAGLGLEDAVTFMGQQPNPKVLEEMARSSYFVMVSKPEALGLVYIEAMSQGCLAIGTEGEGVEDIIKDGENGFLVPVDRPELIAERIRSCEADPDLRERIRAAGQQTVRGLTWDRTARQYEDLFRKVTS